MSYPDPRGGEDRPPGWMKLFVIPAIFLTLLGVGLNGGCEITSRRRVDAHGFTPRGDLVGFVNGDPVHAVKDYYWLLSDEDRGHVYACAVDEATWREVKIGWRFECAWRLGPSPGR